MLTELPSRRQKTLKVDMTKQGQYCSDTPSTWCCQPCRSTQPPGRGQRGCPKNAGFISCWCSNQSLQTGRLKTTEMFSLMVWNLEVWHQSHWAEIKASARLHSFQRFQERTPPLPLPGAGGGCNLWFVAPSYHPVLPQSRCLSLCCPCQSSFCLLLVRMCVMAFCTHLGNPR